MARVYLSTHFSLVCVFSLSLENQKGKWIKVIASNITNNNGNEPYCFLSLILVVVHVTHFQIMEN